MTILNFRYQKEKAMKYLLLLTIFLFLFSCSSQEQNESEGRKKLKERVASNSDSLDERTKYFLENTKVSFSIPIVLESAEHIAVPIKLEEIYVEKEMPQYSYFNIAVLDKEFAFKKYLFEKSVVIRSIVTIEDRVLDEEEYYDDYESKKSNEFNSLLFFDLWEFKERKEDYRRLFVYDLKNDSLLQLSLPETHVINWSVVKGKNAVYIHYLRDSNNDGKFDEKDDANMIFVSLSGNSPGQQIFNINELKKLKLKVASENK